MHNHNIRTYAYIAALTLFLAATAARGDVVIADAVQLIPVDGPATGGIVLDDGSPGFCSMGGWTAGSFGGGYDGDYLFAGLSDTAPAMAWWQATVPEDGEYDVTLHYPAGSNRSRTAFYRILHADGLSTASVDQTTGGDWSPLGRFRFDPAKTQFIQLSSRATEGLVEDLLVDDGDALFALSGAWTPGTVSPGFQDDYYFTNCAPGGTKSARWSLPILVEGNYELSVWFSSGGNRNPQARYRLECKPGVVDVLVDQTIQHDGWYSLGVFPFDAGTHEMTLSNDGLANSVVIADAFRAVFRGTGPVPPQVDPQYNPPQLPRAGEAFRVAASVRSFDALSSVFCDEKTSTGGLRRTALFDDGFHDDGGAGDGVFAGQIQAGQADSVSEYRFGARTIAAGESYSDWLKCLTAYDEWTSPELRLVFSGSFLTPEDADSLLERVRMGNFNTICATVRAVADAAYQSSFEPMMAGVPEGFDPLGYLIEKAHDTAGGRQRIEIHPLVLVYRVLTVDTPPPGHVLDLHPEWISHNYAGETYVSDRMYIDQGVPEAQDYLVDVFMEIIEKYDVDGFNLDTIRYLQRDCGYNPIALQHFHQFTGRSDRPAIDDPEWSDWRREQVTSLVRRMYANILKQKPHVLLTMDATSHGAVQPAVEDNVFWNQVYQAWPVWLEGHMIDGALGMAYREEHLADMALDFRNWRAFFDAHQSDRQAVAIVGAYRNYIQHTLVQLHDVRQSGDPWLTVFSDGSSSLDRRPPEEFYAAARAQLFPSPVPVPRPRWKTHPTGGTVMGRIWLDDAPARRWTVVLDDGRQTLADLCGFYVFFGVPPGRRALTLLDGQGDELKSVEVDVQTGRVTERDFVLRSGAAEASGLLAY